MFMFRSTHNALMAAKQEDVERADADRLRAEARYDALMIEHAAFVALVAERTAPKPAPAPVAKREPDAVDTAIQWVAGDDKAKRRYLEGWAKGERRAGKDVDAIAAAIMDGDRVRDDDDGVL